MYNRFTKPKSLERSTRNEIYMFFKREREKGHYKKLPQDRVNGREKISAKNVIT